MADAVTLAQTLWDLGQDDPSILGQLKAERKTLAMSIATGDVTGDIVTGSKNGASYTMRPGYTLQDRVNALGLAIYGLQIGLRPSRSVNVRFNRPM